MRKKIITFFYLLLSGGSGYGQLSENFNDGDFSVDPEWGGDIPAFVVNSANQLQSNNTDENSIFYLSTANLLASSAQWEFWVKINFNPSSANYIDAYLISSSGDLSSTSNSGYFVRIGNTDDEISLYRKDGNDASIKIIDGENGILNHSSNTIRIKIIRDASNQWILYRDLTGTGNSYTTEGFVTDSTYTNSSFFGFLIKQSTSSFFQKHFFDDIEITNYTPDIYPPVILSATAISPKNVDVLFNKPVEKLSNVFSNYWVNNGLGMPVSVVTDSQNASLVHLTFENSFFIDVVYTLTINEVKDIWGNAIENGAVTFSFYIPQQYDIVISEILADPSPQVGLPNHEWLELKNTSFSSINLKGWKISDLSGKSGPMPDFILQPGSFVIVCAASALSNLDRKSVV